jgi:hypothetical protein
MGSIWNFFTGLVFFMLLFRVSASCQGKVNLDACYWRTQYDIDTTLLKKHIHKFFIKNSQAGDDCLYHFFDTLSQRIIRGEIYYLNFLDTLTGAADGEVSEYMQDVSVKLFQNAFVPFFNYVYTKRHQLYCSNIEGAFLNFIEMDLDGLSGTELKERRNKWNTLIDKKALLLNSSDTQKVNFLMALKKKY